MRNKYEEMYMKNEALAYKFCYNMRIIQDEDLVQNIKMALYRAVVSYNESKGIAFSTYAYRVMLNEYNYSFRNKNRKLDFVDNEIYDKEDKVVSIFEVIADEKNIDAQQYLENNLLYTIINDYLNTIPHEEAELYRDYYFKNKKQHELTNKYGLCQSQISRKLKIINKSLQKLLKDFK